MSAQDNDTPRNLFREIADKVLSGRKEGKPPFIVELSEEAVVLLSKCPEMKSEKFWEQLPRLHIFNAPVRVNHELPGVAILYTEQS